MDYASYADVLGGLLIIAATIACIIVFRAGYEAVKGINGEE